jgi:hypothetical protein
MTDKPVVVHHLVAKGIDLGREAEVAQLKAEIAELKERKRQRKPTLSRALREAWKAGVDVSGATIEPGKVALQFGEPRAGEKHGNELDEWIAKRAH